MMSASASEHVFAIEQKARHLRAMEMNRLTGILAGTLKNTFGMVAELFERRELAAQLHALDDRILEDIGLPRAEIEERLRTATVQASKVADPVRRYIAPIDQVVSAANDQRTEDNRRVA